MFLTYGKQQNSPKNEQESTEKLKILLLTKVVQSSFTAFCSRSGYNRKETFFRDFDVLFFQFPEPLRQKLNQNVVLAERMKIL